MAKRVFHRITSNSDLRGSAGTQDRATKSLPHPPRRKPINKLTISDPGEFRRTALGPSKLSLELKQDEDTITTPTSTIPKVVPREATVSDPAERSSTTRPGKYNLAQTRLAPLEYTRMYLIEKTNVVKEGLQALLPGPQVVSGYDDNGALLMIPLLPSVFSRSAEYKRRKASRHREESKSGPGCPRLSLHLGKALNLEVPPYPTDAQVLDASPVPNLPSPTPSAQELAVDDKDIANLTQCFEDVCRVFSGERSSGEGSRIAGDQEQRQPAEAEPNRAQSSSSKYSQDSNGTIKWLNRVAKPDEEWPTPPKSRPDTLHFNDQALKDLEGLTPLPSDHPELYANNEDISSAHQHDQALDELEGSSPLAGFPVHPGMSRRALARNMMNRIGGTKENENSRLGPSTMTKSESIGSMRATLEPAPLRVPSNTRAPNEHHNVEDSPTAPDYEPHHPETPQPPSPSPLLHYEHSPPSSPPPTMSMKEQQDAAFYARQRIGTTSGYGRFGHASASRLFDSTSTAYRLRDSPGDGRPEGSGWRYDSSDKGEQCPEFDFDFDYPGKGDPVKVKVDYKPKATASTQGGLRSDMTTQERLAPPPNQSAWSESSPSPTEERVSGGFRSLLSRKKRSEKGEKTPTSPSSNWNPFERRSPGPPVSSTWGEPSDMVRPDNQEERVSYFRKRAEQVSASERNRIISQVQCKTQIDTPVYRDNLHGIQSTTRQGNDMPTSPFASFDQLTIPAVPPIPPMPVTTKLTNRDQEFTQRATRLDETGMGTFRAKKPHDLAVGTQGPSMRSKSSSGLRAAFMKAGTWRIKDKKGKGKEGEDKDADKDAEKD